MKLALEKILDLALSMTFVVALAVFVVYVAGRLGAVPY